MTLEKLTSEKENYKEVKFIIESIERSARGGNITYKPLGKPPRYLYQEDAKK